MTPFDKHSCSLVGFTNLGDVSNVLKSCERQCDSEAPDKIDKVATHMLAFMVRGIFSKLKFPYARATSPQKVPQAKSFSRLFLSRFAACNIEKLGVAWVRG